MNSRTQDDEKVTQNIFYIICQAKCHYHIAGGGHVDTSKYQCLSNIRHNRVFLQSSPSVGREKEQSLSYVSFAASIEIEVEVTITSCLPQHKRSHSPLASCNSHSSLFKTDKPSQFVLPAVQSDFNLSIVGRAYKTSIKIRIKLCHSIKVHAAYDL